jgi:imidazolonepropionase
VANEMIQLGTTLLEAKSGYGLDQESELKMLQVLEDASRGVPLEISSTFCGAHAVPKGSSEREQTDLIVQKILPEIDRRKKAGQLHTLENIDVFCEKGVFELETTREILEAGINIGLRPNIHADELHPLKGSELAAELKVRFKNSDFYIVVQATAASHLEEISDEGIRALSHSRTAAVLLPTTAYILRLKPPPARKMIEENVIVALGSDFNPNAPCLNMATVMHLACVNLKLSMPEALVAATLNAAYSLGRGKTHGSISVSSVLIL